MVHTRSFRSKSIGPNLFIYFFILIQKHKQAAYSQQTNNLIYISEIKKSLYKLVKALK